MSHFSFGGRSRTPFGGNLMSESAAAGNDKVRVLMAEQLGVDLTDMTPDANILDDLGADSLDVVEMVMAIEEAFDLEVPDEDAEAMRTVGDVEAYVAKRLIQ
jgi:acyl carrier protein